jgi:hypothetical protein
LRIKVSGQWRYVPDELWYSLDGPLPPPQYESNGCTKSFDYDVIDGQVVPLFAACHVHDWHYAAGSGVPRREGDRKFQVNTYRILRYHGASRVYAAARATKRWAAVTVFGRRAYSGGA